MNKNSIPLSNFSSNITSYDGEDGIIQEIFKRIGVKNKFCIEFGARDGITASNTYNLLNNNDWKGLLIEANHYEAYNLKNNYKDKNNVITQEKFVTIEGKNSLDNILTEISSPKDFDLLVIDIDSYDYQVWQSLKNYKPRVVIIEYNENLGEEIEWVQKNNTPNTGTSLKSIKILGNKLGYTMVYSKNNNAIFILNEIVENQNFFINNFDLISNAEPKSLGYFIQANDGSFILYQDKNFNHVEKKSKIYKYDDTQIRLYQKELNNVLKIKPNKKIKFIKFLKDKIKNTHFGNTIYPLILKIYSIKYK